MNYSVSEIFKAIRKAGDSGIRPGKVLLDESKLTPIHPARHFDKTCSVSASQVFGIPIEKSDGFMVVPEKDYLAVWNHESVE